MNTEVKAKWLTALRSGEYRQGANYLRTKGPERDNFCCLGVLCEIAVEGGVIPAPKVDNNGEYYYGLEFGSSSYLPLEVRDWAGLGTVNGAILDSTGDMPYNALTEMNDNEVSFDEIANVIEVKF